MNGRPVPENQEWAGDMPLEMLEKLDDLWAFDAPAVNLKIETPESQAPDDRKAFPVEGFPGAHARGPRA